MNRDLKEPREDRVTLQKTVASLKSSGTKSLVFNVSVADKFINTFINERVKYLRWNLL